LSQIEDSKIFNMLLSEGTFTDDDYSSKVFHLVKDRCSFLSDYKKETSYFFQELNTYDDLAVKKIINKQSLEIFIDLRKKFLVLEDWSAINVQSLIQQVVSEFDVGFGKVGLPLRLALTGSTNSPSIDQTAELLGKDKVVDRINKAIAAFS